MKKILICLAVCLLAVLVLAGCGKKTEAVKAVEAMIDEIGEIGPDSTPVLENIQNAYEALSPEEQKRVGNYGKYEKALGKLAEQVEHFSGLDDMNKVIADVIEAAKTTFSKDGTDFSALIEKGEALLEQYKDLSGADKDYVQMSDEFTAALDALKEAADVTVKAAAEYVKAFNTVYKGKKYEVTGVYCIKQIRDDRAYHIFALTYKNEKGEEGSVFANARCTAETKAETMVKNKDSFFAKESVSSTYNAKENGNVTLELAEVLKLAG